MELLLEVFNLEEKKGLFNRVSSFRATGLGRKGAGKGQMAAEAPVQIGNYRLGKNLGIGAFGKVKRKCAVSGV